VALAIGAVDTDVVLLQSVARIMCSRILNT